MRTSRNYSLVTIGTVNAKANMALQQLSDIRGSLNVEYKYHAVSSSLNPALAGAVLSLSRIAQGDTEQTRDGNNCKAKSLWAKWTMYKHASATATFVRMIWFIDTQNISGSAPSVTDVLQSADVNEFKNHNNRKRFVFMKDIVIDLGDKTTHNGEWYKKMSMQLTFDGSADTDTVDKSLYLLYLSNEATNTPTLLIKHRLRFVDN